MKKMKFVTLMLLLGIFFVRCSKNDDSDPNLVIGEDTLIYESSGGEKTIPVSVDNGGRFWAKLQGENGWASLEQIEAGVKVKVQKNESVEPRSCTVKLTTEGFKSIKSISIEQKGTDPDLKLVNDSVGFDQYGGEKVVDVSTNLDDYMVKDVPSWAHVNVKKSTSEIRISVSENKDRKPREAILKISSDKFFKTLKLHQDGIIYYLLPDLDFGHTFADVSRFEYNRGSIYSRDEVYGWDRFWTVSPMFNRMIYQFNPIGRTEIAGIWTANNDFLNDPEWKNFMKISGFKHCYWDEIYMEDIWCKPNASMTLIEYDKDADMLCRYLPDHVKNIEKPHQSGPLPSWPEFPSGISSGTKDDVKAWEAKHNGVLVDESEKSLSFEIPNSEFIFRTYMFDSKNKLGEKAYAIKKLDMVVFTFHMAALEDSERYYPTAEFAALLKKAGFKYMGIDTHFNDAFTYVNPQTGTRLAIRISWFPKVSENFIAVMNFNLGKNEKSISDDATVFRMLGQSKPRKYANTYTWRSSEKRCSIKLY